VRPVRSLKHFTARPLCARQADSTVKATSSR